MLNFKVWPFKSWILIKISLKVFISSPVALKHIAISITVTQIIPVRKGKLIWKYNNCWKINQKKMWIFTLPQEIDAMFENTKQTNMNQTKLQLMNERVPHSFLKWSSPKAFWRRIYTWHFISFVLVIIMLYM